MRSNFGGTLPESELLIPKTELLCITYSSARQFFDGYTYIYSLRALRSLSAFLLLSIADKPYRHRQTAEMPMLQYGETVRLGADCWANAESSSGLAFRKSAIVPAQAAPCRILYRPH